MRPAIVVLVGTLATATLLAQVPPAAQDTPTFRSGVQLIEVDVVVTDKQGKPVRDLTRDDFEIVEDNRPQQIRTFSLVDLPIDREQSPPDPRAPRIESEVTTNVLPEGRTYVLLMDGGPLKLGGEIALRARQLAEQWLDAVVLPNDRVAVVHVGGTFNDGQPFTNSRRLLLSAMNRALGSASASGEVKGEINRNLDAWRAIKDVSERLGTISGRRKAIVWVVYPPPLLYPASRLQVSSGAGSRGLEDPVARRADELLDAWREAAQAAVNNNVAVYPVDPRGLTTGFGGLEEAASLREVAYETGGVPIGVNTNNIGDGFATIAQDASTYYLLGYTPEPERTDGKFHPLQVRLKRDGVTVRARRGYYAPSATAKPSKPLPAPPEGVSLGARDALRKPVATQGLGIDVSTTAFKGNGKDASVVITAHVRGKTLEFDKGRRLAVSYQVFDVEGKVATGFYKVFGFNLGNESKARATGTGLQFVERISLKPGRYELRLVAEQPDGPIGSVVAAIDAGTFEKELELSGVALASRRANEVLLVGDRGLRGVLPDDPTALRTFRPTDGLSAYAEVYTELDESNPTVRYDLIRVATLAAAITNSAGAIVARGQTQRTSGEPAGKSLREGFRTDFDLSRVTPGGYVLTLEARAGRDQKKTVTRQIPFTLE